jgi:D-serine deaminase-like pyridoxal phosphate-dependent protein
VSVLTEDPGHAREVLELDAGLGLFVDLDPRFGRSGIPIDDRAWIAATVHACGESLRGLHAYEGQVRDRTPADRALRCAPLFDAVCDVVREHRLEARETVTSGTPTFVEALQHPGLALLSRTVSPGIVVYWDLNSEALGIEGFTCAASVLARVASAPGPGRVTLDAGSKSLDAAAGDPCCAVEGWPGLEPLRPWEEHLPVLVRSGAAPRVGELLELLPRHVCPMVNLADEAVLIDGGRVSGIVAVAARGHETV